MAQGCFFCVGCKFAFLKRGPWAFYIQNQFCCSLKIQISQMHPRLTELFLGVKPRNLHLLHLLFAWAVLTHSKV